jgi:hypothetical protein
MPNSTSSAQKVTNEIIAGCIQCCSSNSESKNPCRQNQSVVCGIPTIAESDCEADQETSAPGKKTKAQTKATLETEAKANPDQNV